MRVAGVVTAALNLSTEIDGFALACTDWAGLRFSAIDDHAVDRRLDSKGPERRNTRRKPSVQIADRARGGAGAETGGREPEGGREGKLDGRIKGAGREPGTGGSNRKASPEGPGERCWRKPKLQERSRRAPEGWEFARASIRNGRPGKLKRGASRTSAITGTPRQD